MNIAAITALGRVSLLLQSPHDHRIVAMRNVLGEGNLSSDLFPWV